MAAIIPETTSADAFERYVGGTCLRAGRGPVWREIKALLIAPPREVDSVLLPAVSEPFLAWILSGEVDFQEREGTGPWLTNRIRKGAFFLTSGGAPYHCRWKAVGAEPFQTLAVFIELPLLERAMAEVHGAAAPNARLRDLSAFYDAPLAALIEPLHAELFRREASALAVQGLAQTIAVHLARHYSEVTRRRLSASPSLPGHKLKQITAWLDANVATDVDLESLAARVKLSKFHFLRLFKKATGLSPARYHLTVRMNAARTLLRETEKSVVEVALEVGYTNPSHFAQLFRREAGLSPSDYRRQR